MKIKPVNITVYGSGSKETSVNFTKSRFVEIQELKDVKGYSSGIEGGVFHLYPSDYFKNNGEEINVRWGSTRINVERSRQKLMPLFLTEEELNEIEDFYEKCNSGKCSDCSLKTEAKGITEKIIKKYEGLYSYKEFKEKFSYEEREELCHSPTIKAGYFEYSDYPYKQFHLYATHRFFVEVCGTTPGQYPASREISGVLNLNRFITPGKTTYGWINICQEVIPEYITSGMTGIAVYSNINRRLGLHELTVPVSECVHPDRYFREEGREYEKAFMEKLVKRL